MENLYTILKEKWNSINYFNNGSLQLGVVHPLEWHVAYETVNNKALVIISSIPVRMLNPSKSISTTCQKREDGAYYISFQLTESSQEDVFINMCSDLIVYSSNALSEKEAIRKVEERYAQWRRLMEHQHVAIMSDEKRRGLIGELLYLQSIVESNKKLKDSLDGWVGPMGGDQDFIYDGIWREIKTTKLSSDQISIHSLEQLGVNNGNGELHIYRVESCAPETEDAFTLRQLVKRITILLNGDLECLDNFKQKLNYVGYIDLDIYDKFYYRYFKKDSYDVDDLFPKLTRENVRTEIVRAEYVLSISSIERWKRGKE